MKKAFLALSDGTIFEGTSFGADGEATGEVVFNTSLSGYQEVLTDPSYRRQIVTMTYPHQGNYGINEEDIESVKPWVSGFVVKESCQYPSSWRSTEVLLAYLKWHDIVAISGIDTRALTRIIRDKGAMNAVISTVDGNPASLLKKAQSAPGLTGADLAREVSCAKPYAWTQGLWNIESGYSKKQADTEKRRFKVLAYDFGIKRNILRNLIDVGCDVSVVPANTPASAALSANPDGIFLSNGPGDPSAVTYAIKTVAELIGKKPIFGICLGHQILSLAIGGSTYKLKFGHRGGNQPVMDLKTRKVEITSQNHGFAVDMDSIKDKAELTHVNLNDNTVEGIALRDKPVFSVQYHPEASPGPHDSVYLFKRFVEMMEREVK